MVRAEEPQMTVIRRVHFAFGITEATNTHSEYVILIAFPLQQWLQEGASVLHNIYILRILVMNFI
jgi:hypothetical protein